MCVYSHDAALCNYLFLVRLYVPSKFPFCTWRKYTLSTPSGMAMHRSCLCARQYQRSGYGQQSWFTIKDPIYIQRPELRPYKTCLGHGKLRDRKAQTMTTTHRKKIKNLLSVNSTQGCRTSPQPLCQKENQTMKKNPSQEPATVFEHQRYIKVVGGTQYIAVVMRPDIASAANSMGRHMAASAKVHWLAAQWEIYGRLVKDC